jgi:hypothetical protein
MKSYTISFLSIAALTAFVTLGSGVFSAASSPGLIGDYAEARNCDVWTGPCFANGEINLKGENAVLAWKVTRGAWSNVDLSGLAIVAAIAAQGTLTTNAEGAVRAAVYIDERATPTQEKALIAMARQLAPAYLKDIVKVEQARIAYARSGQEVSVTAGGEVLLETKPLSRHCDSVCGNESGFYPPLARLAETECAKTIANAYSGSALGPRWSDPNKRSAILGKFAL